MNEIIEQVSLTLGGLACAVLVSLLVVNAYLIMRNGLYVKVNCWFCNQWTKVPYTNRNSFYCPSCTQYNGFDSDGDYNKEIPEMHQVEHVNQSYINSISSNGLCNYCNNNQQLKIIQLRKFVPINESNYDQEVEHFQKQLDNAYKLCKKCDKVLKSTIKKQNMWLFGNRLKHLRNKGLSYLDLNSSTGNLTKQDKQNFFLKFARFTLNVFSLLIFTNSVFVKAEFVPKDYKNMIPQVLLPYTVILTDFYKLTIQTAKQAINNDDLFTMPQDVVIFRVNNLKPIASIGFILDLLIFNWENYSKIHKINNLISWVVLVLSAWINTREYYVYINILQTCCSLYQVISSLAANEIRKPIFQRLRRKSETESDISDSEYEDIDDEKLNDSTKTSSSISSDVKSNCTYCSKSSPKTVYHDSLYQTTPPLNTSKIYEMSPQSVKKVEPDLHKSLENLSLGKIDLKAVRPSSPLSAESVRSDRPLLSPSKLQNSWVAGGFWYNSDNPFSHFSRSSSQSSGYMSQTNDINTFRTYPEIDKMSVYSSHTHDNPLKTASDQFSVFSEPAYHFKPISAPTFGSVHSRSPVLEHANRGTFYPVLNSENMLELGSRSYGSPQAGVSKLFKNLSPKSNCSSFARPS